MILTGREIQERVALAEITIEPFRQEQLNPNSYNYRLGHQIKVMPTDLVDTREGCHGETIVIPDDGFVLEPGRLYLGSTIERIGSASYVPTLIGRSSMGRLGLFLVVSADLGHLGAIHCWTLEMVAVQPVRVYPGMIVGQVSFWQPVGAHMPYNGFFGGVSGPCETPQSVCSQL